MIEISHSHSHSRWPKHPRQELTHYDTVAFNLYPKCGNKKDGICFTFFAVHHKISSNTLKSQPEFSFSTYLLVEEIDGLTVKAIGGLAARRIVTLWLRDGPSWTSLKKRSAFSCADLSAERNLLQKKTHFLGPLYKKMQVLFPLDMIPHF